MKSSTQDKAEAMFHKVKGNVKEVAGKISDNPKLETEGAFEKITGRLRKRSVRSRRFGVSSKNNKVRDNSYRRFLNL